MMSIALCTVSFAQTDTKVKKTATIPQHVHNTFSKHKRHNGYVVKSKNGHHKTTHRHTTKKDITKHDD